MLECIDEYELPEVFGGMCACKAQCVYSEKGPWSEVENNIDYQNPGAYSDSDEDVDEDMSELQALSSKAMAGMFGNGPKNKNEEFKMQDDDGDQIDLLNNNKQNIEDDYNQ